MNEYSTLLWSWITQSQDCRISICTPAIPQQSFAQQLFKMLFWWFFFKKKKQEKKHDTEIWNQMYLFSSSIPGNKYLANELMLSVWPLDRRTASFYC